MMNSGFAPFGGIGFVIMVIFWGCIIWAIVAIIRGFGKFNSCGHNHADRSNEKEKSPLMILKERYAKGEIDKKEFDERGKDLT